MLDYPAHTIAMLPPNAKAEPRSPHQIPFTFQHNAAGRRGTHFPRIRISIDGDSIGGTAMPMILVPSVSVAGYTVGPAWFSMRPDRNYRPYENWMDKPIRMSVGGSVFRHFRIVADYEHNVATFMVRR